MAFYQDVVEAGAARKPVSPDMLDESKILAAAAKTKPWSYDRAAAVYDLVTERLHDWAMATPDNAKRGEILSKLEQYEASRERILESLLNNAIAERDAMESLLHVAEKAEKDLEILLAGRKISGVGYIGRGRIGFLPILMAVAGPILAKMAGKLGPKAPKGAAAAAPAAPPAPPPAKGPSMTTIALIGAAVAVPILLILLMPSSAPAYPPPRRRR
jgi:hypothetical protein